MQGQFLYTVTHPEESLEGFPSRKAYQHICSEGKRFLSGIEVKNLLEVFMGKEKG